MNKNTIRHGLMTAFATMSMLLATGCGYSKDIKEYPEPWQTLDPGKPLERFPKIEILEQGGGAIIEPGDLVQFHVKGWLPRENRWHDFGEWWLWIGFQSKEATAFHSVEPDVAGAIVALQQGTALRFLEGKEVHKHISGVSSVDRSGHLKLSSNPLGDPVYYSWRKNTNDFVAVSGNSTTGYFERVEIKRVCKGPLQYRTVRLFDDSPVRVSAGGFSTRVIRDARQIWIDEAKIEATCQDGRKVKFQYGPVGSRSGGRSSVPISGYFDDWYNKAWDSIPLGVQFEGNRPPVVKGPPAYLKVVTKVDTPVKFDLSNEISDPDGDRLKIRIGQPMNGTLTENPDGTFIYTPKPGWSGGEDIFYKVSDGLVESADKGNLFIRVEPPKK